MLHNIIITLWETEDETKQMQTKQQKTKIEKQQIQLLQISHQKYEKPKGSGIPFFFFFFF